MSDWRETVPGEYWKRGPYRVAAGSGRFEAGKFEGPNFIRLGVVETLAEAKLICDLNGGVR